MTIKEAILITMEVLEKPLSYKEVTEYIIANNYLDFSNSKTPENTISGALGDFIRNGDSRIGRIKKSVGYDYFLTKNLNKLDLEENRSVQNIKNKQYQERDLHILLATYLQSIGIFSTTIYHESSNKTDKNQIWIHPDMVGIEIREFKNFNTQNLLKSLNKADFIKLYSYELKREINSDIALKEAYFQALSNSSWANYGYLVAFDFADTLKEEMHRLNQAHGIGFIELAANPFETKMLYPAQYRNLDFYTMDKLAKVNKIFDKFINGVSKIINASGEYYASTIKEFKEQCDNILESETDIDAYCKKHFIQ